jgi:hypothetical protein
MVLLKEMYLRNLTQETRMHMAMTVSMLLDQALSTVKLAKSSGEFSKVASWSLPSS